MKGNDREIRISTVIPAYNSQEYIARAIDSVLAQCRLSDEIIVVDDGSTDGTADAVRAYGEKVRYFYQDNAGVSVARNKGIELAEGNWIAFLDADDEWTEEKLKAQTEHLQKNPELKWTYTNYYIDRPGCDKLKSAHHGGSFYKLLGERDYFDDYLAAFINQGHAWTCTLLIEREVFERAGGFEPGMKRAQDNDLWFRIGYQYPKVGYLCQPLSIYHLDTPDSSTKINDHVDFMVGLVDRHLEISDKFGRQDAFKKCVTHMVSVWVRKLIDEKRFVDAVILVDRFDEYLSDRFKREIRFRLMFPPVTNRFADAVMQLKKICK